MDPILKSLTLVDECSLAAKLDAIVHTDKPITVGFLNQYAYNLIHGSHSTKSHFFDIDYLFRDGKGIELACRYNHLAPKLNLNGTDFIPALITQLYHSHKNLTFFAYGTQQPWLSDGAARLFKTNEFYCLDGFQHLDCYLEHYIKHQTEALNVVVLAMGMPKQEQLAARLKLHAKHKLIIICGGAILDFQAGRVTRAPKIFRKFGFEWLYRLFIEPKRLFARYVIGIPQFFWHVCRSR